MRDLAGKHEAGARGQQRLSWPRTGIGWSVGVGFAAVLLALLIRILIQPLVGREMIYLTFYPAVVFAAVAAGWRAGILSTALALICTAVFYLPRAGPGQPWTGIDHVGQIFFGLAGLAVSWVAGVYHGGRIREARIRRQTADQESELRFITDSVPGLVGFIGSDLRYKYVNRRYEEWFGEPRERMLNQPIEAVIGREAAELLRPYAQRALAGEEVRFELQVPYRRLGPRWVDSCYVPRRSSAGEVIGFHVLVTDITERREAEDAMRLSEARLRQAVQVARFGIFEHDHLKNCITCSPEHCQLFGLPVGEPVTIEAFLSRIHPEDRDRIREEIRRAHDPAGTGTFEVEHRVVLPGDEIRWIGQRAQTYFAWEGAERRPVRTLGAAVDITARKEFEQSLHDELALRARSQDELEKQVRERTAELRESVRELEHFSHALIHDMRAPLRAMQGFSQMLELEHSGKLDDVGRDYLRRIAESANRLDHLVVDALNYSKVVLEDLPIERLDPTPLLRSMVESYPEFQEPHASIELPSQLPEVLGNRAALTQCFSNLLQNAVKFVEPGRHPRVRIWAEQAEARGQGRVTIYFQDNGIGINGEDLRRIYGMFQRLSRGYEGTGIGLALVRKAVEKMKGRVGVASSPGKGSRFWLELAAPPFQDNPL